MSDRPPEPGKPCPPRPPGLSRKPTLPLVNRLEDGWEIVLLHSAHDIERFELSTTEGHRLLQQMVEKMFPV